MTEGEGEEGRIHGRGERGRRPRPRPRLRGSKKGAAAVAEGC